MMSKDEILAFFGGFVSVIGAASIAWSLLIVPGIEKIIEAKKGRG